MLSLCGCGWLDMGELKEQRKYEDAVSSFFEALDNQDVEAICNLFSPAANAKDEDLRDQIDVLLSIYDGPTSEIGWDGLLAGEASYDGPEIVKTAYSTFPVRCDDVYYWCYLEITYESTFDRNRIGITQIDFYTADEYCIFYYDDNAQKISTPGLNVFSGEELDCEVRCIGGWPHKYSKERVISLDAAKDYFASTDDFSIATFKADCGEPCAEHVYTYYELDRPNGEPRYLELGVDYDGSIFCANVVGDFGFIECIFNSEE